MTTRRAFLKRSGMLVVSVSALSTHALDALGRTLEPLGLLVAASRNT